MTDKERKQKEKDGYAFLQELKNQGMELFIPPQGAELIKGVKFIKQDGKIIPIAIED